MEVTFPGRTSSSYKIENLERSRVRLLDPRGKELPLDTTLVKGSLLPYKWMNFEYIERSLGPRTRDSLITAQPNHVVRITSRDGKASTAKFWYMPYTGEEPAFGQPKPIHDPIRMHALIQDTLRVVVQRQMFDPILQPVEALLP